MIKKIIGAILVASPFVALAAYTIVKDGVVVTAAIFGIAACVVAILAIGICLLVDNDDNKEECDERTFERYY